MSDAVVIPGRLFGPCTPLPMFTGDLAAARGATVHRHQWTATPPGFPEIFEAQTEEWVRSEVGPLLDRVGGRPLLIAKSLGTNAAALAAERDLPAIWLTLVLTCAHIVAAMRRATAPFLLVGGTGDDMWDGPLARTLTPHVHEVPDADHGMYVPGPVTASIAVLSAVVTAAAHFLDHIAWPPDPSAASRFP